MPDQRAERKEIKRQLSQQKPRPQIYYGQSVHELDADRVGKFASDLSAIDGINGRGRGAWSESCWIGSKTLQEKIGSSLLESILIDQIPAYGYVQVPELNEVQPFFLPDEDDGEAPQNKKNTNKKNWYAIPTIYW